MSDRTSFEEKVARIKREGPPKPAQQTVSRRSLLDWMGKATVFALGAEVLAACDRVAARDLDAWHDAGDDAAPDAWDGGDADLGGGDAGLGGGDADLGGEDWSYSPPPTDNEPRIYDEWPVRTVDRQILENVLETWDLQIDGMVDHSVTLTFPEVLALTRQDQITDFHCVEGWSIFDVPWNGVHLSTLLELTGVQDTATHVTFSTLGDRYNESLPLDVAFEPRTLLAYGVTGHTLPLRHGFPMRLIVPRLFGYKSAKYIQRIELTDEPYIAFWERLGYSYDAEVPEGRLREGRY